MAGKYSLKERLKLDEMYDSFTGMAPRQQGLVAAAVILGFLILILIPVTCASSRLGRLQKEIQDHEKNVGKVLVKVNEYNQVKVRVKDLESKIKTRSQVKLRTTIDAVAAQSGVNNNIDIPDENEKKGEDYIELTAKVRISKLSLLQVIDFISGLERQSDITLQVKSLQINPTFANRAVFDGEFEVSTFVSAKEEEASEK